MAIKALTDPRVKPDPGQLLRMLCGSYTSEEDFISGCTSIAPLYAAPEEVKDLVETNRAVMSDCISRHDIRDRLVAIKVPTFLYVGRYDWITPPPMSEYLADNIQNLKLFIFENSGHLPALKERTLFRKEVLAWIQSNGL
ncbi:hypothetical protein BJ170DRAFT_685895 [Xylariales sp. AK1849]|nr:hypothetical protein BJ170DRAFT_685895 [Xylariales sp. AK1849]